MWVYFKEILDVKGFLICLWNRKVGHNKQYVNKNNQSKAFVLEP